jgi:Transglycosylase SLT domain
MSDAYTTAQLQSYAAQAAAANGVPTAFFEQLIGDESSWRVNPPVTGMTSSGAPVGIAQITTGTAKQLGVDPTDPIASLNAAAGYLKTLYNKTGSWLGAAQAYGTTTGAGAKNVSGLQAALNQVVGLVTGTGPQVPGVSGTTSGNLFTIQNGERLIAVLIGVIFVVGAIIVLMSQTSAGKQVIETVKDTATKAAVVAA